MRDRPDPQAARRLVLAGVGLLCCAVLTVGWWSKARCLGEDAWARGEQYTRSCYTDVYALWFAARLDAGAVPYRDHPLEYPVLTGAQMWAAATAVGWVPADRRAAAFFHATAAFGAAAALATLVLLARAGLPPARLLWYAAAPTLALTAFVNWDPLPVALLVAGVVAHQHGHDATAGGAAGLGAAAKLFPALLVPLVVTTRLAQRRPRDAAAHTAAAAAAWLAVNLPVLLTAPVGWRRFIDLNRERQADWDSLWYLAEQVRGAAFAVPVLNAASAAVLVAGAAVIVIVGARRRPPERWWELALPLLAWFLLTNKVYSPQFSLWLLPLLALASPRAAPVMAFLVADAAVFLLRFPFLGGLQGLEPAPGYGWFAAAVAVRAVVLLSVIVDSTRTSASAALPRGGGR
ncbi:MAG TPA: glycosyltransferase 87 family protein [Egibacteraceae bacterium]|nr:glycosyltransferase 87 family protein [Egibacteraceae bacterium]